MWCKPEKTDVLIHGLDYRRIFLQSIADIDYRRIFYNWQVTFHHNKKNWTPWLMVLVYKLAFTGNEGINDYFRAV
jgi:hypothetical protein